MGTKIKEFLKKYGAYIITGLVGFFSAIIYVFFLSKEKNTKQVINNTVSVEKAKDVISSAEKVIAEAPKVIDDAKAQVKESDEISKVSEQKITTIEKTVETIDSNIAKRNEQEKDLFKEVK